MKPCEKPNEAGSVTAEMPGRVVESAEMVPPKVPTGKDQPAAVRRYSYDEAWAVGHRREIRRDNICASIATSICLSLLLWVILGSVMLALRDTVDGELVIATVKPVNCCCGKSCGPGCGTGCYHCDIDFVGADGQSHRCRGGETVDYAKLCGEDRLGARFAGAYETVTGDCWHNKPLAAATLALIGGCITAALFLAIVIPTVLCTRP